MARLNAGGVLRPATTTQFRKDVFYPRYKNEGHIQEDCKMLLTYAICQTFTHSTEVCRYNNKNRGAPTTVNAIVPTTTSAPQYPQPYYNQGRGRGRPQMNKGFSATTAKPQDIVNLTVLYGKSTVVAVSCKEHCPISQAIVAQPQL